MSRLRINWFSPLRPANTAIAHYAMRTLAVLAHHADMMVWTQRAYWPRELEQHATVRRWEGHSWADLNSADATLYHIGNDVRQHGWIWDVARQHPGVMVLHDTRLHDFFLPKLLEAPGREAAYLDTVRRYHGAAAVPRAQRMLRGEIAIHELAEEMPLTALAVERARGAVVHSTVAFEQVASLERCPVLQLDLPYVAGPSAPPRTWDGVLRLVVFGYLGANRRLEALLDAVATFPERDRLRLDILGRHHDPTSITERISELGLNAIVKQHGFVPEGQLDDVLDSSHLAVNLRYPTMGEASDSQLRIWSRGLASLVTRVGWYAELPADAVLWVDPQTEIEDLHRHFRNAIADPGSLQAIGDAGRRVLEARHDPELYASELLAGLERMMRTPASVLQEGVAAVTRVMDTAGIDGAVKAALARRTANELSRWVTPIVPE